MKQFCVLIIGVAFSTGLVLSADSGTAVDPTVIMPHEEDQTAMWWKDGFPSHSPQAPWHRCVQTGYYGFVFDTQTMQFPHLGPIAGKDGRSGLPPAQLGLKVAVDGKDYFCTAGGPWTKHGGPRLIESGRFFQRSDVTDLVFTSKDGEEISVEARFEIAAWSDRLGLILAARPGKGAIEPGEKSFGKVGGGFGLDGSNHLEVKHDPKLDTQAFTFESWVYVPKDYRASRKTYPWIVCKNSNEARDGNFGITIVNGIPKATINIGGGSNNKFEAAAQSANEVDLDAWNHLAISYDGDSLRLYINGRESAKQFVGRQRVPRNGPLAFGRRQDNHGDGYHFRGVIDEAAYYSRALTDDEIKNRFENPGSQLGEDRATMQWHFRSDGSASATLPTQRWGSASMAIGLRSPFGVLTQSQPIRISDDQGTPQWSEVSLAIDPTNFKVIAPTSDIKIQAVEIVSGKPRPVRYEPSIGWHRINLDGIKPVIPTEDRNGQSGDPRNDAMERIRLVLSNPTDQEQVARLMFDKTKGGFLGRVGSASTGVSAILRDAKGQPTGIPVQLSKNWHNDAEAGVYRGAWFHGISQVRLPAGANVELELSIVNAHWGGVAAASHAQLCLIGWGSNQLWEQSALGAWGESICYEPDQVQANCTITDVRPLMVGGMNDGKHWKWTCNVGGGDHFRIFDGDGERVPHTGMKTTHHRQGPCLTEVTYAGRLGKNIAHSATVCLARTDDLVRGTYQLKMKVKKATDVSRLIIFQIGADTYSFTGERKMAIGDASGLQNEWDTQWGSDVYRTEPIECKGESTWVSLHDAVHRLKSGNQGAWANRGIVIRSWKARIGGKEVSPWIAEHGVKARGSDTSTIDILIPPGIKRLEPGDFVEATVQHIIMPQFARDYYGPNEDLRTALGQHENTWRMIHREAKQGDRKVQASIGKVQQTFPDVRVQTTNNEAKLVLTGGVGYVPITFTELRSPREYVLEVNGQPIDQSVHGNDFWQTEYDASTQRWSQTFNLPSVIDGPQTIHFHAKNSSSQ